MYLQNLSNFIFSWNIIIVTAKISQCLRTLLTLELSQYQQELQHCFIKQACCETAEAMLPSKYQLGNNLSMCVSGLTSQSYAGVLLQEFCHWFCRQAAPAGRRTSWRCSHLYRPGRQTWQPELMAQYPVPGSPSWGTVGKTGRASLKASHSSKWASTGRLCVHRDRASVSRLLSAELACWRYWFL